MGSTEDHHQYSPGAALLLMRLYFLHHSSAPADVFALSQYYCARTIVYAVLTMRWFRVRDAENIKAILRLYNDTLEVRQ